MPSLLRTSATFNCTDVTVKLKRALRTAQLANAVRRIGVSGENLACSGAKTSTFTEGETFKPGLDFYNSGGREGQALMLQHFAATHNVKLVAVSIGGNNFHFASIVQTCIEDFLFSPSWWPDYCNDDSSVTSNFTSANVAKVNGR